MGIYLNPGNAGFRMAMNSEIFVDKTEMIAFTNSVVNTNQRYVSVSRPRRFGKTMAADMLCAYYGGDTDTHPMFEKCEISSVDYEQGHAWDYYLGKFDVIRLVMTDFFKNDKPVKGALEVITKRILGELNDKYPDVKYDENDFFYSIEKFYRSSHQQFVIIIDEWDAVFREKKEDRDGHRIYLDFLRDWLKDKEYIALAYITGILPIKKMENIRH